MEIMSASHLVRLKHLAFLLPLALTSPVSGEIALQKVPPLSVEQAPAYPENLARTKLGTEVEVLQSAGAADSSAASALLSSDPAAAFPLSAGTTTVLLTLPSIENLESISFLNNGAAGNLTVATSNAKLPAESAQWNTVAQQEITPETVKAKIGPAEAKYVRLTFEATQPGKITSFGVYPNAATADFTMPRTRTVSQKSGESSFGYMNANLADLHSRARAVFVSSGTNLTAANNMLDEHPTTTFDFATTDAAPTAVIDLGKAASIRKVSAIHSARPGRIEVYVMSELPSELQQVSTGSAQVSDASLSQLSPVATAMAETDGRTSVEFTETSGRYLMLRWLGEGAADTAFTVAEIAAFGGTSENQQLLAAAQTTETESEATETTSEANVTNDSIDSKVVADGKEMIDSKEMVDSKDMPEDIPAEGPPPPNLPPPPPFTFIPQIVPTSP